jgi:hypothetical protein
VGRNEETIRVIRKIHLLDAIHRAVNTGTVTLRQDDVASTGRGWDKLAGPRRPADLPAIMTTLAMRGRHAGSRSTSTAWEIGPDAQGDRAETVAAARDGSWCAPLTCKDARKGLTLPQWSFASAETIARCSRIAAAVAPPLSPRCSETVFPPPPASATSLRTRPTKTAGCDYSTRERSTGGAFVRNATPTRNSGARRVVSERSLTGQ